MIVIKLATKIKPSYSGWIIIRRENSNEDLSISTMPMNDKYQIPKIFETSFDPSDENDHLKKGIKFLLEIHLREEHETYYIF